MAFMSPRRCRIEAGGKEESPERQTISLPVVFEIAAAIPVRYRVLVLLATFTSAATANATVSGLRPAPPA
jgi:hypothetical protein